MNTFKKQPNIQQKALKKAVESPNIGKHGKRKITLLKEEAFKEVIQRSVNGSLAITESMLIKAVGSHYVYKRVNGRIVMVEDPKEIEEALNECFDDVNKIKSKNYYFVIVKEPDTRAGEFLLNRAFGKPKEEITNTYEVKLDPEKKKELSKAIESLRKN